MVRRIRFSRVKCNILDDENNSSPLSLARGYLGQILTARTNPTDKCSLKGHEF
jgi:hypothetical protein